MEGLLPYTRYQFALSGYNSGGVGPDSSTDVVTAQGKPGIPDDVETDPFAKFIRLKWKEPKMPNGVIIKYHLFINKDAKPRNVTVDGNTRMYYFGGLVPQTGYILSIQAETKASIGNRKTVTETTISPQGKHSIFVYRIVLHAFVYFVTFEAFRSSITGAPLLELWEEQFRSDWTIHYKYS